jgi:hypothetical protein
MHDSLLILGAWPSETQGNRAPIQRGLSQSGAFHFNPLPAYAPISRHLKNCRTP